jgi:hypothetical protein
VRKEIKIPPRSSKEEWQKLDHDVNVFNKLTEGIFSKIKGMSSLMYNDRYGTEEKRQTGRTKNKNRS